MSSAVTVHVPNPKIAVVRREGGKSIGQSNLYCLAMPADQPHNAFLGVNTPSKVAANVYYDFC